MARKKFILLLSVQVIIYLAIRLLLLLWFQNNPGGLVEFHLQDHASAYLDSPLSALFFFSSAAAVALWAIKDLPMRPTFLRDGFVIIGAPLLLLYFFLGKPFEVRVFLEVYPVLLLLLAMNTVEWFASQSRKR